MKRSTYNIQQLLDEIKETIPFFKEGQIFETLKSIYPDVKVSREKKNISYKGIEFTKPLASNRKAKHFFLKEESPLKDFYKDITKGDFLQVIKVNNKKAYCINLSLKEDIREKFYKNDYVVLDYLMIANGIVKQYKRQNIKKYFVH